MNNSKSIIFSTLISTLLCSSLAISFTARAAVEAEVSESDNELANYTYALDELEQTSIPVSDDAQTRASKLINYLVDQYHYRSTQLDDSFSETVLDQYLDQLDPARLYFLQHDISEFQKLSRNFDDYIREGTLEPAFAIFEVYRKRVEQRIKYALIRLHQGFDFELDESYLLDRSEVNWAMTHDELDDAWRKRIKFDVLNLRLSQRDDEDTIETLTQRYAHIVRRTRQLESSDVFQLFINAYVGSIEPHTSYFSPRGSENFKIRMRLSLEGIGAVLQTENEYTLVRRVIPGGPADMAGDLQANDKIVGVGQDGEEMVDVIGWRLDDVVDLIRGPKESLVNLEIIPGQQGAVGSTKTIQIQRDQVKLEEQAASKRVLDVKTQESQSKIGVIDLPSFYVDFDGLHKNDPNYRSTTVDVKKLLTEFQAEGIDGLVIDLRGNGGGALVEAISLTGLFISEGPVVQVESSGGEVNIDRDTDPEIAYDGPLVVLVDRYSASASEIFAGAIQDYRRGLIIGEPTFGKGTVQNLVNLNRYTQNDQDLGQLKVTVAQFFRINGDSTQFRGVIPDVIWPMYNKEEGSGERAYENAIPWKRIEETHFEPYADLPSPEVFNRAYLNFSERIKDNPEFQFAMDLASLNQELRDQQEISLVQQHRLDEQSRLDKKRFDLENKKRVLLGEEAFDDLDSFLEDETNQLEAFTTKMDEEADVFLKETSRILSDYIFYQYQIDEADVAGINADFDSLIIDSTVGLN